MVQGWLSVGSILRPVKTERSAPRVRLIALRYISPQPREIQKALVLDGEPGLVTSLLNKFEQ